MAATIYPDSIAVGQVETFRIDSSQPGQTFALAIDPFAPEAHVMPIAGTSGTRFTFYADVAGQYTVVATGDLGDVAVLPEDLVQMERAIVARIAGIVQAVPRIGPVHQTERFLEGDNEDVDETTTPDPVAPDVALTNYVEIGVPAVGVVEHSGQNCVELRFEYPLSYTLGVRDSWNRPDFPYKSSGEMFIATYLLVMRALAQKRTLGFVNTFCGLLQQERPSTLTNEEGEALDHIADWTLIVSVKRPL
jgi:hypothetical protein